MFKRAVLIFILLCASASVAQNHSKRTLREAMDLYERGEWANAASVFERAEHESPGTTDALLFRGKALSQIEHFNEAAEALEAYLKVHPKSADARYAYSYVLFRQSRQKESIESFAIAADLRPPTTAELIFVALDYSQLDDIDDANYHLEKALTLSPNDFEANYQLGRLRYRQRRPEQAVQIFRELAKRDPNSFRVQLNLGLSLESKGDNDQAAEAYRRAISVESLSKKRSELPYLYLGRMLIRSNKADDATAIILHGLVVNPRCSRLHTELGRVYFTQHRIDEAREELEKVIELDPRSRTAHYFLARLYASVNLKERAEEQFQLAKELSRAEMGDGTRGGMGGPMEMPPE